jgi:excisionase family DNA binding protein
MAGRIDRDTLYTVDEVAEQLKLKPGAVRKWIRDGKVKARRPGKSFLILGADLLDGMPVYQPEVPTTLTGTKKAVE